MAEAEIFWPESLPTDALLAGAGALRDSGVETTCRLQPVRRGAGLSVLVLLTTAALDPFLKAVFEHVGKEAWQGLRQFVHRLTGDEAGVVAVLPEVVVFESAVTGAQFVFTTGLPAIAFQQAIELDPGTGPGRWVWDTARKKWIRFEERTN